MPVTSAGILLYRDGAAGREVWLGRMGGPLWRSRPRAWSIPKGQYTDEEPLVAALREFREEIGTAAPEVPYRSLGAVRQRSGKIVTIFAGASDFTVDAVVSNTFELEWPPRSGLLRAYPEIEAARWFPLAEAREQIVVGQVPFLDAVAALADP